MLPSGYSSFKASTKTLDSSADENGGWSTMLKPGRNVYHMKPSNVTSVGGANRSAHITIVTLT